MELELHAYTVGYPPMTLIPAARLRDWMERTPEHFANRCLPLLQANQSGWVLLNPVAFCAQWDGGIAKTSIILEPREEGMTVPALSHFGSGIVTWTLPYLFRTPPGYNLLVRGPANLPKDGIAPLEGLVETDSEKTFATFTMNWKFTRPGTVTFAKDEPFCMLIPHAREDLETWMITCLSPEANPDLHRTYQEWSASRTRFNGALERQESEAVAQKWQKDYFQAAQQTKRRLACPLHTGGADDH